MEQKPTTPPPFISIDSSVEIEAPIAEVFERWCRVEEFPSFMEGVREIRWLDEKKFSLKSENDRQFYHSLCELTLHIPEHHKARRTNEGPDSTDETRNQKAPGGRTE